MYKLLITVNEFSYIFYKSALTSGDDTLSTGNFRNTGLQKPYRPLSPFFGPDQYCHTPVQIGLTSKKTKVLIFFNKRVS